MTYAHYQRRTTGALPAIPELWEHARRMFQRVIDFAGDARSIEQRKRLTRSNRKEILAWFTPVAALVRRIVISRAIVHLLMTPEGRKVLRMTARTPLEPKAKPVLLPAGTVRTLRIPHPGWHTIWQPPRKTPPASPSAAEGALSDRGDPSTWPCSYRLGKTSGGQAEEKPRLLSPGSARPLVVLNSARAAAPSPPAETRMSGCSAWRCARKIETLRRVIENPRPAILRMARYLARHSPNSIVLPRWDPSHDLYRWRQGDLYADQAEEHALLALRALHRSIDWLDRVRDEPG